jgi:hypothetical protein
VLGSQKKQGSISRTTSATAITTSTSTTSTSSTSTSSTATTRPRRWAGGSLLSLQNINGTLGLDRLFL